MQLLLCSLAVLGLFVSSSSSEGSVDPSPNSKVAQLLLSKQVQNKYLVEGMDIVVKYGIYNIGDLPAVDVSVSEMGFPDDSFDVVSGQTSFKLDRIPPHSNNTHTLVVRPKKFGYFNFTSQRSSTAFLRRPTTLFKWGCPQTLDTESSFHSKTTTSSSLLIFWTGSRLQSSLSRPWPFPSCSGTPASPNMRAL
uniref:Translocon-associated protein subunit beta n=1 Tax=Caligus rogercresseyi TaxID=217165 RepID=C1BQV1_CALRO|nr:Translocon-associated protein subunit beta precursor [Caligus rogercresseyi]